MVSIPKDSSPIGVELLKDIQRVFEDKGLLKVPTADLINYLCEDKEAPWSTYNENGQDKKITPRQLSHLLSPYQLSTKNIDIGGVRKKGFEKTWFKKSWKRYLSSSNTTEAKKQEEVKCEKNVSPIPSKNTVLSVPNTVPHPCRNESVREENSSETAAPYGWTANNGTAKSTVKSMASGTAKYQQRTREPTVQYLTELQGKLIPFVFPLEWEEAIKTVLTRYKPKSISPIEWANILLNIKKHIPHFKNLIRHGWSLKDIFGCHPTHPHQRLDYMGLIMLLEDKVIHEVTKDGIILKTYTGAFQTFRRPLVLISDQITLMELEDDPSTPSIPITIKPLFVNAVYEPTLIKSDPIESETVASDVISFVRTFEEIKASGLEEYYHYFEERAAIREFEGGLPRYDGKEHLANSADWQAMNDTTYKFMEDNNVDQGSLEVNQFIKKMLR